MHLLCLCMDCNLKILVHFLFLKGPWTLGCLIAIENNFVRICWSVTWCSSWAFWTTDLLIAGLACMFGGIMFKDFEVFVLMKLILWSWCQSHRMEWKSKWQGSFDITWSNVVKKWLAARVDLNDGKLRELTHWDRYLMNQVESCQTYPAGMPTSDPFIGPMRVSYYQTLSTSWLELFS